MVYQNSIELMQLHGVPIYMNDMLNACLIGRLNLFLQGDTGSGKTQLARDAMKLFLQDRSLFILGRNDMDTRELFQQINLGKLNQKPKYSLEPLVNPDTGELEYYYPRVDEKGVFIYQKLDREQTERVKKGLESIASSTAELKELTSKINTNLIVVDELPNCVPAVRAQLFNLFDGFIEINGIPYSIGNDYSVGIATGNIGQKFTESSNELGRALKDRMHVVVDTDYFFPTPNDTFKILSGSTNPRVEFSKDEKVDKEEIINKYREIIAKPIPHEKLIIVNYLLHGLDYCSKGSKRKMKDAYPTQLENHEQGSDVGLVLPVSPRAAKSIIRLSQSLDQIAINKGASSETVEAGTFNSMMQAYKFVSAYSGVLNEASVEANYGGNKYEAMDAIIRTTTREFEEQKTKIFAGIEMVSSRKLNQKVLNLFVGRWTFMRSTLGGML